MVEYMSPRRLVRVDVADDFSVAWSHEAHADASYMALLVTGRAKVNARQHGLVCGARESVRPYSRNWRGGTSFGKNGVATREIAWIVQQAVGEDVVGEWGVSLRHGLVECVLGAK